MFRWLTKRSLNNFDGMWAVWFGISVAYSNWWMALAIIVGCPVVSVIMENIIGGNYERQN